MKTMVKKRVGRHLTPAQKLWLHYYGPTTVQFPRAADPMIFILQSAAHSPNLGDYVIAHQQRRWLQQLHPKTPIVTLYSDMPTAAYRVLKKQIRPQDLLVIQGGGNLGDIWANSEYDRQLLTRVFRNNRLVVLPESVYFSNTASGQALLHRSQHFYRRHKQLTLLARDAISYQRLQTYFPQTTTALVPDMVLTAPDLTAFGAVPGRVRQPKTLLLLLRRDKEKRRSDALTAQVKRLDWSVTSADTVVTGDTATALAALLAQIQQSALVVTDRLHGLIFCYLTQTPCLFVDNLDHKLSHFYATWLSACPWLRPTTPETLWADQRALQQALAQGQVTKLELASKFEPLRQALKLL